MFSVAVALLFSCYLFGTATAVPFERRAPAVIEHCTTPNTVALTFDDGPYKYMNDIVDTLKAAGGKGTFFVNGDNWSCIYNEDMVTRMQYAYNAGFQFGSHTWAHKNLSTLARAEIISEMSRTEQAIQRITGALPAHTRPPYGEFNDLVRQVAAERNQKLVNWDFDSGDSVGVNVTEQKKRYDVIAKADPPKSTILSLQHEVYESSAHEVLKYAISVLKGKYKFVTLAECLGDAPYLSVGAPSARNASWAC